MMRKRFLSACWLDNAPFVGNNKCQLVNVGDEITPDDVLILWGGEDIRPELYNHPRHRSTGALSPRDLVEWELLKRAIRIGASIIGICRGAQLLCAAAGGSLIQDVYGHVGDHSIVTNTGETYTVNSLHHQQMYLEELNPEDYTILAASSIQLGHEKPSHLAVIGYYHQWKDNQCIEVSHEPEAVWFNKIKGLAIQWHPEYLPANHSSQEYVGKLVNQFLLEQ